MGGHARPLIGAILAGCTGPATPADTGREGEPATCPAPALSVVQELDTELIVGPGEPPAIGSVGLALEDLDGDGDLDLVVATMESDSLFLANDGTGRFDVVARQAPAAGAAVTDGNGDGLPDVHLAIPYDADQLLVADGTGGWFPRTLPSDGPEAFTGSWGDMDGDGDLDGFVAGYNSEVDADAILSGTARGTGNVLLRNDGGTFADATDALPADVVDDVTFLGQWLDADADGDLDLYLANDYGPWLGRNRLLLNDGAGRFTDAADCACDRAMFAMGAAVGDPTGDGLPDLYLTNLAGPVLLSSAGDGTWIDRTLAMGADVPNAADRFASWGVSFVDLDSDGLDDLPMVFGQVVPGGAPDGGIEALDDDFVDGEAQRDALLLAGDDGFRDASAEAGFEDDRVGRSLVVGDLDRDGRPDLVTAGLWYVTVWRTDGGCGPGVTVRLGPDGVGARVDATVGGRAVTRWLQPATTWSSSAHEVYVGLGGAAVADAITVTRLDGSAETWTDVPAGTVVAP